MGHGAVWGVQSRDLSKEPNVSRAGGELMSISQGPLALSGQHRAGWTLTGAAALSSQRDGPRATKTWKEQKKKSDVNGHFQSNKEIIS